MIEKNKATKENLKAQKQIVKLKERKPSVSKSTTTIPVYFSEASTSTISPLASDASPNTSPVHRCSQISQTSHHSDIPYRIEMPLPPIKQELPKLPTPRSLIFSPKEVLEGVEKMSRKYLKHENDAPENTLLITNSLM